MHGVGQGIPKVMAILFPCSSGHQDGNGTCLSDQKQPSPKLESDPDFKSEKGEIRSFSYGSFNSNMRLRESDKYLLCSWHVVKNARFPWDMELRVRRRVLIQFPY